MPEDLASSYGELILHAENPVRRVRYRTIRWVLLVVLALVLATAVTIYIVDMINSPRAPGDPLPSPPWWLYVLTFPAVALLGWGFWEFFGLLPVWRHVGWSVDVYEQGVVESRFGTVRQAMPYFGGVLDLHHVHFTSPHPHLGSGRLSAPWRAELQDAASAIQTAAQPVLVRETLAQLRAENAVSFPGKRAGALGITLTMHALRLPDGREYEYSSLRMRYSISDGTGGSTVTDNPARADRFVFLSDDGKKAVPGLVRTSPNLAVVREVLHVLIDPEGHEKYTKKGSRQQEARS